MGWVLLYILKCLCSGIREHARRALFRPPSHLAIGEGEIRLHLVPDEVSHGRRKREIVSSPNDGLIACRNAQLQEVYRNWLFIPLRRTEIAPSVHLAISVSVSLDAIRRIAKEKVKSSKRRHDFTAIPMVNRDSGVLIVGGHIFISVSRLAMMLRTKMADGFIPFRDLNLSSNIGK